MISRDDMNEKRLGDAVSDLIQSLDSYADALDDFDAPRDEFLSGELGVKAIACGIITLLQGVDESALGLDRAQLDGYLRSRYGIGK